MTQMNRSVNIVKMVRMLGVVLSPVAFGLALGACGDSATTPVPGTTTSFSGSLILVDDESGLPGLEVTLFDPLSQTAVARDVSDSAGRFAFDPLPAGSFVPVVHANGFRPIFLSRPRWTLEEGDEIDVEIRMRRAIPIDDSIYSITGFVSDLDTGLPIANARAEMNFAGRGEVNEVNWSEYTGWATTLEDTTDEEGKFFLDPVPVIFNANFESVIPEIRFSAPGYESRTLKANTDPKTATVTIFGVGMRPGANLGSIDGVVRDLQGNTLEGVPVSAEWRQQVRFAGGAVTGDTITNEAGLSPVDHLPPDHILLPDGRAWTNESGEFHLTGLPRGFFNLRAGAGPEDGWVGFVVRGVEVPGFNATGHADLIATVAVAHTSPADGVVLDATPAQLLWEAYPGAGRYRIEMIRGSDAQILILDAEEPVFEFNPGHGYFVGGGSFAWQILALDGQRAEIGISDRRHVFHIQAGDL